MMVRVIAHRGASGEEIENTLEAFRRALLEGAHGVEMDVRRTRDGELIVFHDDTLERLAGRDEAVEDLTLQELMEVSLRLPSLPGKIGGIPTLEEVISDEELSKVTLCLEIKSDGIEKDLVDMVRRFDLIERVIIYSFHVEHLVRVKGIEPRLRVNLLFGRDRYRNLCLAVENGIDMINPEHYDADEDFVNFAVRSGLTVTVGKTNDPEEVRRLARLPIWGLHTDFPAMALEVMNQIN
jgi:glycerophosphoryl diester phosphodiesterase